MPKPCGHAAQTDGCRVCHLTGHSRAYQRLWGLPETAAAELPPGAQVAARTPAPVRRPLPCVHLGRTLERKGCVCRRQDLRECQRGHGPVSQDGGCETCPDYEADD